MESKRKIILDYRRSGGRKPPRDREILNIFADGEFMLWRSISSATYPPTPIGRFSGKLDKTEFDFVEAAIKNCSGLGNFSIPPVPDSSIETISMGNVVARVPVHEEPDEPWGGLLTRLRDYLSQLTHYPESAVSLEVFSNGQAARLAFLGNQPLTINLAGITIRAVQWDGFRKVNDWFAPLEKMKFSDRSTIGQGWTLDLPFNHNFSIETGHEIVAYVTFSIFDGDEAVSVSLESGRKDQ